MRLVYLKLMVLGCLILCQATGASAQTKPEFAAGPVIGSTGIGIEAAAQLMPDRLNLNTGLTGYAFDFTENIGAANGSTHYHAKARLGGVPIFLSFYPGPSSFNLQAGMFVNYNRISFTTDDFDHGHNGKVAGSSHFNLVAPFIGIGFGQPFAGNRFTVTGNLGVAYAGGPDITLHPSDALVALDPAIKSQLEGDQHQLNRETKLAQIYPLLSIGVEYRF